MQLDQQSFERLRTINWFSKCAEMPDINFDFSVEWIPDWSIAVKHFTSPDWEDTTLQARNALTAYLATNYQNDYQDWNKITIQARDLIIKDIMPIISAFQQQQKLPTVFCDCVRWDLLAFVMESTYKRCNPPFFFTNLIEVYLAGRFPCGWKGEWPNGRLMVI